MSFVKTKNLDIYSLGLLDYDKAYQLQQRIHKEVVAKTRFAAVLILEHRPVITAGRQVNDKDLLISKMHLRRKGIDYHEVERGGLFTAHMPGQLVVYPILPLKELKIGVRRFVFLLEESIMQLLKEFGILAKRKNAYPGIWTSRGKIAFVGVRLSQKVSFHGLALNVNCDLGLFDLIVPCGIKGCQIVSLSQHLGSSLQMNYVIKLFLKIFCRNFEIDSYTIRKNIAE